MRENIIFRFGWRPVAMLHTAYGDDYMPSLPEGQRSNMIPYRLTFGDEEDGRED